MGLIFPFLIQFAAAYIILTYGSNIINQAGTHLPLEVSSISLAVAQVLATFLTFSLVDAKGRKLPLILSLTGCALGHLIMAAYLYLGEFGFDTSAFHVLPIACMAFVVFNASVGNVEKYYLNKNCTRVSESCVQINASYLFCRHNSTDNHLSYRELST